MEPSYYIRELCSRGDWRVNQQEEMLTDWIDGVLTPGYYSFYPL